MPTLDEFERAAHQFREASDQARDVASAFDTSGASEVVIGGVLGHEVPSRLSMCADLAMQCAADLESTAQICDRRAAVIAAYEVELARYDLQMEIYEAELLAHHIAGYAALLMGGVDYSLPPIPPIPPPSPPAWADVRRAM